MERHLWTIGVSGFTFLLVGIFLLTSYDVVIHPKSDPHQQSQSNALASGLVWGQRPHRNEVAYVSKVKPTLTPTKSSSVPVRPSPTDAESTADSLGTDTMCIYGGRPGLPCYYFTADDPPKRYEVAEYSLMQEAVEKLDRPELAHYMHSQGSTHELAMDSICIGIQIKN